MKAAKNPNHQPAVVFFDLACQAKYKAKYLGWKVRGGKVVKQVRQSIGNDLDRFQVIVSRFLADNDPFDLQQQHAIHYLTSELHRWADDSDPAKVAAGSELSPDGVPTVDWTPDGVALFYGNDEDEQGGCPMGFDRERQLQSSRGERVRALKEAGAGDRDAEHQKLDAEPLSETTHARGRGAAS